jgi:hypothetical protein
MPERKKFTYSIVLGCHSYERVGGTYQDAYNDLANWFQLPVAEIRVPTYSEAGRFVSGWNSHGYGWGHRHKTSDGYIVHLGLREPKARRAGR